MTTERPTRTGPKQGAGVDASRTGQQAQQETAEQRQNEAMQRHRGNPTAEEAQVRREQGGHDRPVGSDHVPHPRPQPGSKGRK
ncbi:hypothetical protein H1235_12620 [Pseudoxanthomonas sp. NC8]|nr:hypothetical protein H1235_12620 [Pseudoxanthomonas sp. NC8]